MQPQQEQQGIRLIKPAIVAHCNADKNKTRNSIYSCDIQKGGERIATGGGDSFVKIWNLSSLLATPDGCDNALQASLCNHTKSVNVVRWSRDGQFLASGSDDCYILLYKLDSSGHNIPSQPFGSNTIQNKECWSRCLTLHGHTMDVLDLDWSPKGYIASASIDNKIMIWDLTAHLANPNGSNLAMVASPFRVLDSHKSFVKGISFDPVGSFLASSSADNVVMLWNMESWTVDATLTEPMEESVDRTIFRRMSWAPDGGSLCLSSATKAAKPVGMVVKRDTWECLADLVGHEAQSTCCRFAPYIKVAEKKKKVSVSVVNGTSTPASGVKKKQVPCTIVALGDQQGVVSVWSTVQNTPLLVLRELFAGPVLDIAWTSLPGDLTRNSPSQSDKGAVAAGSLTTDLLACTSLDGTLCFAMFDSGSLSGKHEKIMTAEEQENHFRKMYGRAQNEILETPEPLVEGPSVLRYRDGLNKTQSLPMPNSKPSNTQRNVSATGCGVAQLQPQPQPPSAVNILEPRRRSVPLPQQQSPQQQKVTVLKSGKKRIQPMLLNNSNTAVTGTLLSDSPSTQILSNAPNYASSKKLMSYMQNSTNGSTTSGFAPSQVSENGGHSKRAKVSHPNSALNDSASAALQTGNIISLGFHQNSFICRSAQVKQPDGDMTISGLVKSCAPAAARGGISSLLLNADIADADNIVTSLQAKYISCPVQFGRVKQFNKSLSHITAMTARRSNAPGGEGVAAAGSRTGVVWDAYVNGEVTALCGLHASSTSKSRVQNALSLSASSDGLCVIGTNDGALHLLSLESGLRLSPVFIVGAPVVCIDLLTMKNSHSRILLVTAQGDVWLYDHAQSVPEKSNTELSFVFKTSLQPLLVSMRCGLVSSSSPTSNDNSLSDEQELEIQRAYLSLDGEVVVSVRSKKQVLGGSWQTFQYCQKTQLWMRVADMRNLLSGVFMGASAQSQDSQHFESEPTLELLNKEAIRENNLAMSDILAVSRASLQASSTRGMDAYTNQITLSHIEERMATAFSLTSMGEARLWLMEWTAFCCKHQLHKKVRWAVNRLIMACNHNNVTTSRAQTQLTPTSSVSAWAWLNTSFPDIQGVSKIDILRDTVLPAISRSTTSQTLLIEITDVLDSLGIPS